MHLALADGSVCENQPGRRISQVAFHRIRKGAVIAGIFCTEVALKRGTGRSAGNLAVPFHAAGNRFGVLRRARRDLSNGIDKVLVGCLGLCFKLHVQQGVPRREQAVNRAVGRRRFEFASADKKRVRIIAVVQLP